jgi:hypothetical protein
VNRFERCDSIRNRLTVCLCKTYTQMAAGKINNTRTHIHSSTDSWLSYSIHYSFYSSKRSTKSQHNDYSSNCSNWRHQQHPFHFDFSSQNSPRCGLRDLSSDVIDLFPFDNNHVNNEIQSISHLSNGFPYQSIRSFR